MCICVCVCVYEGFLGGDSLRFHRRTVDPKLQSDPLGVLSDVLSATSCPRDQRIMWLVNTKKCFHGSFAKYILFEWPIIAPNVLGGFFVKCGGFSKFICF